MSELDIIRDLAKQVLIIPTLNGFYDSSLWDRAQRLVRNVEHISRLPELGKAGSQTDRFCLITATYFSDAGLACHLKAGNSIEKFDNNGDDTMDCCRKVVEEKLSQVVSGAKIDIINKIIAESHSRDTRMTEAMILSDARNVDDMGATGIFSEFRRYVNSGKSVSDAVNIWKRKVDYGYWQARLKESFRIESVQRLAEKRLLAVESFMNQLQVENTAGDFEEFFIDSIVI